MKSRACVLVTSE